MILKKILKKSIVALTIWCRVIIRYFFMLSMENSNTKCLESSSGKGNAANSNFLTLIDTHPANKVRTVLQEWTTLILTQYIGGSLVCKYWICIGKNILGPTLDVHRCKISDLDQVTISTKKMAWHWKSSQQMHWRNVNFHNTSQTRALCSASIGLALPKECWGSTRPKTFGLVVNKSLIGDRVNILAKYNQHWGLYFWYQQYLNYNISLLLLIEVWSTWSKDATFSDPALWNNFARGRQRLRTSFQKIIVYFVFVLQRKILFFYFSSYINMSVVWYLI